MVESMTVRAFPSRSLSGPDDRLREPEGRRRQDHDGGQPREPICAIAGDRVLVIDLDPQGNATSGLGLDRASLDRSVYDAVIDDLALERLIVDGPLGSTWSRRRSRSPEPRSNSRRSRPGNGASPA